MPITVFKQYIYVICYHGEIQMAYYKISQRFMTIQCAMLDFNRRLRYNPVKSPERIAIYQRILVMVHSSTASMCD